METLVTSKISNDKILAILLFGLLYFFNSKFGVELKFVVLLIFVFWIFSKMHKFYKTLLNVLLPLIVIISIAIFSSIFYNPTFYDVARDFLYLSKPLLAIYFGCYLALNFKDKNWVLKILILYCFFTSIIHIYTILINLEGKWNTTLIRTIGGKGSEFEAFVFSFFLCFLRKKEFNLFSKRFNKLFFAIVSISICLYLSRTTFIAVILFLISFYGLTHVTKKQVIYLFGVLVFFVSFMISLQFMNIKRGATGIESFFYKLKMAPGEIFDSDINTSDHSQLWDNWRAYEVKKSFDTMKSEESILPYISGMGIGSLVNLGFEVPLGREDMQYIPHIHNGYAYVFFKSGLVGLFLLFVWLFSLYAFIYKRAESRRVIMYNKIISGLGLYLFFSTLVITGIYNLGFNLSLTIGLILGLTINAKTAITK